MLVAGRSGVDELPAQRRQRQQDQHAQGVEHPLDDPEADSPERQTLTEPPQHRVQRDRDARRRERGDEAEQHAGGHLAVVGGGVGEVVGAGHRRQKRPAEQARRRRHDEQHPGDDCVRPARRLGSAAPPGCRMAERSPVTATAPTPSTPWTTSTHGATGSSGSAEACGGVVRGIWTPARRRLRRSGADHGRGRPHDEGAHRPVLRRGDQQGSPRGLVRPRIVTPPIRRPPRGPPGCPYACPGLVPATGRRGAIGSALDL